MEAKQRNNNPVTRKRIVHPFACRLPSESAFPQNEPGSLVGTGFTSMALGIITAFRPTPMLLLMLSMDSEGGNFFHMYAPYLIFSWLGLIFLALFVGGLIMTCSRRIRKRSILLLHPWALLLLYFDAFFWLSATIYLHITSSITEDDPTGNFIRIEHPIIFFIFVYLDIVLFLVLHYLFATYFITAQLTVIEKFF